MLANKLRCWQRGGLRRAIRPRSSCNAIGSPIIINITCTKVPTRFHQRRCSSNYKLKKKEKQEFHDNSNGYLDRPNNPRTHSTYQRGELPTGIDSSEHQQSEFYFFRVLLYRLAMAYGTIYCISEYGFQLTNCNGPSMLPTLKPQAEIIFVDRLTPRLFGLDGGSTAEDRIKQARKRQMDNTDVDVWHQPFIPANELPKEGKWKRFLSNLTSGIHIGDVVVVEHPQREGTICKRVLGLPGDEIILKKALYSEANRQGLLKVPDGHLWIEGDNSSNSLDSRTYGPVAAAMIVGRVPFRVWPLRGNAMIERGMRPRSKLGGPLWGVQGSTVLPAGYEGETIDKGEETESRPSTVGKERKYS